MLQRMATLLALALILSAGLPAARAADALYGPVRPGESFWTIADTLRDKPRVSQEQEMLALYLYNTESFTGGLGGLQKGSTLRVPTAEQALEISQEDARRYIANLHRYKGVPPSMQHLVRKAGAATAVAPVAATAAAEKPATPEPEPAPEPLPANEAAPTEALATPAPSDLPNPVASPEAPPPAEDASAVETLPPAGAAQQQTANAVPEPEPAKASPAPSEPVALPTAPGKTESGGTDIFGVHVPLPMDWLILIGLGAVFLLLILTQAARVRRALREEAEPVPPAPPKRRVPIEPVVIAVAASKSEPVEPPVSEPAHEPEPVYVAPQPVAMPLSVVLEPLPEEPAALNDPIADADFQLGYGHFDDAIRGLEEALLISPMNRDVIMKLAEIYSDACRPAEFEQLVSRYNGSFGDSDWLRVQSIGRQLRPESQLFGGWVPVPSAFAGGPQAKPADALDLSTPAAAAGQAIPVDQLPPEFGEFDLDSIEPEDGPFTTDDVGTKLDLARAYLDMEDQEMARSLLDEVVEQGSEAQRREAQDLLDQLRPPPHPIKDA